MPVPSSLGFSPWSLSRRRRRGHGASVSGQDRRGDGGDLAVDFCFPSSSSSRRRLLLRRQEDGGWCTGAAAVDLGMAAGCLDVWSVLGSWLLAGGSGAVPRPCRRVDLDLEVEDGLGVVPRPAFHSDRWVSLTLLLVVHKAILAMEFLQLRACWLSLLFLVLLVGAGGERRLSLGAAANPRDLSVILSFFKGCPAICTGLRVWCGRISTCVRILYCICL